MSFLICDNKVTKLDIPLINVPSGNGTYLLLKTGDTWEWKSYTSTGTISVDITEGEVSNQTFGIELILNITNKVKFINSDGITVYYDDKSIQLNGLIDQCFILIKEPSSFRCTTNEYGSVTARFISAV